MPASERLGGLLDAHPPEACKLQVAADRLRIGRTRGGSARRFVEAAAGATARAALGTALAALRGMAGRDPDFVGSMGWWRPLDSRAPAGRSSQPPAAPPGGAAVDATLQALKRADFDLCEENVEAPTLALCDDGELQRTTEVIGTAENMVHALAVERAYERGAIDCDPRERIKGGAQGSSLPHNARMVTGDEVDPPELTRGVWSWSEPRAKEVALSCPASAARPSS